MNILLQKQYMLKQLNLFYIALGFLSRIPLPSQINYSQKNLNQASRYFSLVGWLIGGVCALTFFLGELVFPKNIAILLSMMISLLLTGCFHEDGLADTCDGLGGGWEQKQKLAIMKDSRLGTYGAAGLWFTLMLKYSLLNALSSTDIIIMLLVAHPLSRSVSTMMIYLLPYVSDDNTAKVKPLAESLQKQDLLINLLLGCGGLLLVFSQALWLVMILITFVMLFRLFLLKQINGFTGDTLGASQQIAELLIYLTVIALEKSL